MKALHDAFSVMFHDFTLRPELHMNSRDVKTEPGFCSCIIPVTADVENRFGTLHGGCIGVCFDATPEAFPAGVPSALCSLR